MNVELPGLSDPLIKTRDIAGKMRDIAGDNRKFLRQ
jgi:hypothetical protein